jgi:hypothetical protein
MINRITILIGLAMLFSQSLCGQKAEISELLDRYVGLDGPLPRNEKVVSELLESPELLKAELLDRIEDDRPLPELYFYGVLADRSMDGILKYKVWRAAANGSLRPDAEAWSSAESVIAFLPLARAEDAELLEKLSNREFPLAPGLPGSLKQRIDNLETGGDLEISPKLKASDAKIDRVKELDEKSGEVANESNLADEQLPSFPKWALSMIVVAVLGILVLLIRAVLRRRAS